MTNSASHPHGADLHASPWVTRFAPLIPAGGAVLDLACGHGRHARWLAARGWCVLAVDRDADALAGISGVPAVDTLCADLEGDDWPLAGRRFDGIVVTNYLFRPRFEALLDCLKPGGVLIYETFMRGNERFGRPANPEFLLRPGELLERLGGRFTVLAFEQGVVRAPREAVMQRICALAERDALRELPAGHPTCVA